MTWVVVSDPIPAGARVLGEGDGRDSRIATLDEDQRARRVWPTYIERSFSNFRAYYEVVPRGRFTIDYTLRLNNAGEFTLPPTRVEARMRRMYLAKCQTARWSSCRDRFVGARTRPAGMVRRPGSADFCGAARLRGSARRLSAIGRLAARSPWRSAGGDAHRSPGAAPALGAAEGGRAGAAKGCAALEDKRFLEHAGVDSASRCRRRLEQPVEREDAGRSTLTMQLVSLIDDDRKQRGRRSRRAVRKARPGGHCTAT